MVLAGAISMAPNTRILRYGVGFFISCFVVFLSFDLMAPALLPRADLPNESEATPAPARGGSALWRCRRLGKSGPRGPCAAIRLATEPAGAVLRPPLPGAAEASAADQPNHLPVEPQLDGCAHTVAGRPARRWPGKAGAVDSLQERALKVELIIGAGTVALGKEAAQMFDRLEERIGLRAGRGRLLPAER